jgi:molecular chaperone DnaJ
LGCKPEVPTIHDKKKLSIPKGTQSGQTFTIKNEGVPHLRGSGRGDMIVEVQVITPTKLNKKQMELLKEFGEFERKKEKGGDEGIFKKLLHLGRQS